MKTTVYIFAVLSLMYCTKENKNNPEISPKDSTGIIYKDSLKKENSRFKEENLSKEETLKNLNTEILSTLKSKDDVKFSNYIHPEKGVRFSMYAFVNPKQDKHFSREEFIKYAPTNIKFTWGEKDGIGDPLVLSLKNYIENWVFKKDFTKSKYYLNSFKGGGNSLNNLKEIYPTQDFTENFNPGTEQYSGMDWNCLRLVFEELNGTYYLIAVINDEWTI